MEQGFYLEDEFKNEVLLPRKFITPHMQLDDELDVFLYFDSDDRPVATTQKPRIQLHQFAYLKVTEISRFGAFMDWELDKDLLVPFRNQPRDFEDGKYYCIYLYLDPASNRLVGTGKTNPYFSKEHPSYEVGQEVSLLVCEDTDLGVNVIVDNQYKGLAYYDVVYKKVKRGDYTKGYIQKVREDGKLDISLEPIGASRLEPNAQRVLDYLIAMGGSIELTDKSKPDAIYNAVEMSKKAFKNALGNLYRSKKILLTKENTQLLKE